jgi:branched-chain amino acid transport system permease protein
VNRKHMSLIIVFMAMGVTGLLDSQAFVLTLLTQIGILSVVAVGLNLLVGTSGLTSLGQAGFFAIGAYVSALLLLNTHLGFLAGLVLATLASAGVGMGVGFLGIRLKGHYLAIGTLAFAMIVYGLVAQLGITGGNIGLYGIPAPALFGLSLASPEATFWLVWVLLLLAAAVGVSLQHSRMGRALQAIREDEGVAASLGIGVTGLKVQVFALAAGMAGAAGAVYASYLATLAPSLFSITLSFDLLVVVVLGGIESLSGTILAVALYTLVPDVGQPLGDWRLVGYAVLVLIAILLFPGGLGALLDGLVNWAIRGWHRVAGTASREVSS